MSKTIHYTRTTARLAANIVDNFLVSILTFFIVVILTFASFDIFNLNEFISLFTRNLESTALPYEQLKGAIFFSTSMLVLYTLLSLIYFQVLLSKKGSTFGMDMFQIRLVNLDGSVPSFNKVFIRNILFILFKFLYVGGLSIITMLGTKDHQALHDMVTSTTVVKK